MPTVMRGLTASKLTAAFQANPAACAQHVAPTPELVAEYERQLIDGDFADAC